MSMLTTSSPATGYGETIQTILRDIREQEADHVRAAATALADRIARGGVVHVFGAGHSQLVAADTTFRAGGAAWMNGILDPALSIARGALASTATERIEPMADGIFDQVVPQPHDATIAVTNSGVTPITRRWAERARDAGLLVIGIASKASTEHFAKAGHATLDEVSHHTLNNHVPVGDVAVGLNGDAPSFGPVSTIVTCFLAQWLIVHTHEVLHERGEEVHAFKSGHMSDSRDHNAALIARYGPRIDVL
jgi:uncharacterized phosphosugar-binding protein